MEHERFNKLPLEERYLLVKEYGEPLNASTCCDHVHIFYMLGSLWLEVVLALEGLDPISVNAFTYDDPEMDELILPIWLVEIEEFCRPGHDHPF